MLVVLNNQPSCFYFQVLGGPDDYENQNLQGLQSQGYEIGIIISKASGKELTTHYLVKCLSDKKSYHLHLTGHRILVLWLKILLQHQHQHQLVVKPREEQINKKQISSTEICKFLLMLNKFHIIDQGKSYQQMTCSTFSLSSHPLPAITTLIDPAWTIFRLVSPLDLAAAIASRDFAERSASAFK